MLERLGHGPVHLIIDRVELHELHARDIRLYGGAVQATNLTMGYAPFQLLAHHLASANVAGLRVMLAVDGSDITLGGRPLRGSVASSEAFPFGGLQIDSLKLDDARVTLDRPSGRLEVKLSTEIALAGADLRGAALSVDLMLPMNSHDLAVRVVVPTLTLSAQNDGSLGLKFTHAAVTPKDLPWAAEDIDGEVALRADGATAKLAVNRLVNLRQPAFVQPLHLTGDASLVGTNVDFTLRADTQAAGGKSKLSIVAKGRHDPAANSGYASITATPMVFDASGVQPADFFPILRGALADVEGTVTTSGSVRWHDFALTPNVVVKLSDLSFGVPDARLSHINGAISLIGLWPPTTPPNQALRATVEAGRLPPSNITLAFQLLPTSSLIVETATIGFAGGRISTSSLAIDPAKREFDTVLEIDQIDVAELFRLIDIDGLGGTGRLNGHIPMRLVGDRVRISKGALAASGPGVLRFSSDKVPKEILDAGESVKLTLDALRDFRYETMALELDKAPEGNGTILVKLHGHNPAVLDGRPFIFNIKFESDFDRLTALFLHSITATQELLRRAFGVTR